MNSTLRVKIVTDGAGEFDCLLGKSGNTGADGLTGDGGEINVVDKNAAAVKLQETGEGEDEGGFATRDDVLVRMDRRSKISTLGAGTPPSRAATETNFLSWLNLK